MGSGSQCKLPSQIFKSECTRFSAIRLASRLPPVGCHQYPARKQAQAKIARARETPFGRREDDEPQGHAQAGE
jgi:hypothetical protein